MGFYRLPVDEQRMVLGLYHHHATKAPKRPSNREWSPTPPPSVRGTVEGWQAANHFRVA